MTPSYKQLGKQHILFDPELFRSERVSSERVAPDIVEVSFFDPEFWRRRGALVGQALGRGTTYFVQDGSRVYALRHYRRGGMLANWVSDRYIWPGVARTRPWQEWSLLKTMFDAGLPVPRPVAARAVRHCWSYSADLVTLLLPDCRSLADMLGEANLPLGLWGRIGMTVRRFHDTGIDHADLNAHNILLNKKEAVYLIDFDKGRQRVGGEAWKKANLSRLHRSLVKVAGKGSHPTFSAMGWQAFLKAYDGMKSARIS